jgi:SEC-C motif
LTVSTGRNDPCPCGSGRKYKKCCLALDEARERAQLPPAQQALRDEDEDRASVADDVGSPADLQDEELPLLDVTRVSRIAYASGFVGTPDEAYAGEGLAETVWNAPGIPAAILECLDRERVAELEGEWGDATAATPIQVEQIELTTDEDVIALDVFNRAMLLFMDNTDETRRVHRVCVALERAAKEPGPEHDTAPPVQDVEARTEADRPPLVDIDALLKAHRSQGGTCELCGVSLTRRGAVRHLERCAPAHDKTRGPEQTIVHLRVTAPGASAHWLDVEARADAKLEALDGFLRRMWLECCGHLSQFRTATADYFSPGYDFGFTFANPFSSRGRARAQRRMTARLREALPGTGERVQYEYDFGSTTPLVITVGRVRRGRIGGRAVRLLARNTAPVWPCELCGEPAVSVCALCWTNGDYGCVCRAHEASHGCDEPSFLPVVNSPRMGVCGYVGPDGGFWTREEG